MKKNNETIMRCWKCGKIRPAKYKCLEGEASEKGSESNTSNVFLAMEESDLL